MGGGGYRGWPKRRKTKGDLRARMEETNRAVEGETGEDGEGRAGEERCQ